MLIPPNLEIAKEDITIVGCPVNNCISTRVAWISLLMLLDCLFEHHKGAFHLHAHVLVNSIPKICSLAYITII